MNRALLTILPACRAQSAREAKHAGQSHKRRKMAEDLEKREREYEAERGQEQAARSRLHVRTLSHCPN